MADPESFGWVRFPEADAPDLGFRAYERPDGVIVMLPDRVKDVPAQVLPPPDDKYVKEVCKIGQGHACCRYLVVGPNGWGCVKLHPPSRAILDRRVREETMVARGDNCPGRGSGD